MKTASLFALSCDLGAGLANADPKRRIALRQYGQALGTAYQIYDDCLDLFGSETVVGKSLGTDLASGKLTLPILVILERADASDLVRLKKMLQPWESHWWASLKELLEKYKSLNESRRIIHQYLETARQTLADLPQTESQMAMVGLADFLAQQTDTLAV